MGARRVAILGFLSVACTPSAVSTGRDVTRVSGRLDPAHIQRVVRSNYGGFRRCYESGLARYPALEGRVQVRFVIGRDGRVQDAKSVGSTMPDQHVVNCVVSKYYGLTFSPPEGGIVIVVYPIMFAPG